MTNGKVAILYANDKEGNAILENFKDAVKIKNGVYSKGKYLIYKTGVGKKSSRKAVNTLFTLYPVRGIISIGTAGSLSKQLKSGNILATEKILNVNSDKVIEEFEYFSQAYDKLKCNLKENGFKLINGTLISVDNALMTAKDKKKYAEIFSAHGCDMETAIIAEFAGQNAIPLYCFRVISDNFKQNIPPLELILSDRGKSFSKKLKKILLLFNPVILCRFLLFRHTYKKSLKKIKLLIQAIDKI